MQDGRFFITLVSTGSAAGVNGTNIFVLKGKRLNGHFTDQFLWSKGCIVCSTIMITEKAFMNNKACTACTEHLMNGYRNSGVVKDNQDWEMIEFLYGLISHGRIVQATIE